MPNSNYNKKEILSVIETIRYCVKNNCFLLSMNNKRLENREFITRFNLSNSKIKGILCNLNVGDFCYSTKNNHVDYKNESLYVFAPKRSLFDFNAIEKDVCIYIKINILKNKDYLIVISFHEANKKIEYYFK